MNIVYISPYPPLKDGLAGYTRQFVEVLRAKGHDVGVISTNADGSPAGARVGHRGGLMAYLAARRPDIVHVQYTIPAYGLQAFGMWLALRRARRQLGFALIVTFHEVARETALLGVAGALYIRAVAVLADHVTVHTREAARLLQARCQVPAGKISCVPHPLYIYDKAAGNVAALRTAHSLRRKRVVLFFGYIHVDKGIDHLVRAFAAARAADKRLADTVLVIAGSVRVRPPGLFKLFERKDRRYESLVHALVEELGLRDHVRFVPYVPDADVASWFAMASCVVLPYTNLEQSGVLNIALGCKTPIIASRLGGLGETLAGTQALVPPANDAALAKKLRSYLTKPEVPRSVVAAYAQICASREVGVVTRQLAQLYASLPVRKAPDIVHVVPNYPPHLGGTEQVAHYLAQGSAAAGRRIDVYTARASGQPQTAGVLVHGLRSFTCAHSTFLPGLLWALLRGGRPRLMHIHYSGELGTTEFAALAARLRRVPYVLHVHNDPTPSGVLGIFLPLYKRVVLGAVLRRAPAIIALTEAGKQSLTRTYRLPLHKISVVPNAVREMFFADDRRTAPGALHVLYAGRLSAEKDVAMIIEAIAQLENVHLDIVGDGELRGELTALAARLHAPVTFWGALFGKDLVARYRRADVFCLASRHEQFGIVLLEAMASRAAVVAGNIPGVYDVVEGAGVLVTPRTAEAIAAAVRTLQANPAALRAAQDAGSARACQFTVAEIISQLEPIYNRLCMQEKS